MIELERFIIFDNTPPTEEGVSLDLIWHYPEDIPLHDKLEYAGMFFALGDFTASIIGERCDYIQTKDHEWSSYRMEENIIICAITKSPTPLSRKIMHILLRIMNNLYHQLHLK